MTLSRPRTTGRVLRGSALGLGLLVAGGLTAPEAFAMDDPADGPTSEVPADDSPAPRALEESPAAQSPGAQDVVLAAPMSGDFGTGKDFNVTVSPSGDAPADLDLSGAVFRATPTTAPATTTRDLAGDPSGVTCTTDVHGTCTFDGPLTPIDLYDFLGGSKGIGGIGAIDDVTAERADATLPAGFYTLTQVSGSPGLSPAGGSATFGICDTTTGSAPSCGMPFAAYHQVDNDSLFRTSLVTTVTDADTGAPIACAAYELTGPDYPHRTPPTATTPTTGAVPAECTTTTAPTTTSAPESSTSPTTTDAGSSSSSSSATDDDEVGDDQVGGDATETTTDGSGSDTDTPIAGSDELLPFASDVVRFARETSTVSFGMQTSDATGTLTFTGWFLPAEGYLLTPISTPAGYAPDVTDAFGITTTATQAAAGEPAAVSRTLSSGQLSPGTSAPSASAAAAESTSADVAAAAPTTMAAGTTAAAAAGTTSAPAGAALATTGSPVGTMLLLGGGLVALGGGALATGTVTRRRARQRA